MPYTQRSKENLLREGIERQRIFVIGNPMVVSLHPRTADTLRVARFGLDPQSERVPLRGARRPACTIL